MLGVALRNLQENSGSCESMQHLGDVRLTSFVPASNAKRSYFPSFPLLESKKISALICSLVLVRKESDLTG